MFYVKYRSHNESVETPFTDKNTAIKYFNHLCDRLIVRSITFDHIEITNDDGLVLFEYEV